MEESAGQSLCQIERCCPACESDKEAIDKGFGTVCDGSVPTAETFASRGPGQRPNNADIVFNLETPGCLGDFNVNAPEYKAAIVGLVQHVQGPAAKVDIEWVENYGGGNLDGGEALRCLPDDGRRRSSLPTPSAPDGVEEGVRQRRGVCSPVDALPKEDTSVLFAVRIRDIAASKIEETWNALTEDALNRVLAERCQHPVQIHQNNGQLPLDEGDDYSPDWGVIVMGCIGATCAVLCLIGVLRKHASIASVTASQSAASGVWQNVDWDSMPVCVCLCGSLCVRAVVLQSQTPGSRFPFFAVQSERARHLCPTHERACTNTHTTKFHTQHRCSTGSIGRCWGGTVLGGSRIRSLQAGGMSA